MKFRNHLFLPYKQKVSRFSRAVNCIELRFDSVSFKDSVFLHNIVYFDIHYISKLFETNRNVSDDI